MPIAVRFDIARGLKPDIVEILRKPLGGSFDENQSRHAMRRPSSLKLSKLNKLRLMAAFSVLAVQVPANAAPLREAQNAYDSSNNPCAAVIDQLVWVSVSAKAFNERTGRWPAIGDLQEMQVGVSATDPWGNSWHFDPSADLPAFSPGRNGVPGDRDDIRIEKLCPYRRVIIPNSKDAPLRWVAVWDVERDRRTEKWYLSLYSLGILTAYLAAAGACLYALLSEFREKVGRSRKSRG